MLSHNYCTATLLTPSSPNFKLVTFFTNLLIGPSGSRVAVSTALVLFVSVVFVFFVVVFAATFLLPVPPPFELLLFLWYPPTAAVCLTLLFIGELLPVAAVDLLPADVAAVDSREEAGVRTLPEKPAEEE